MKTLLITRPRQEAQRIADMLAASGFASFTEPLLRIEHLKNSMSLHPPLQAILTTSSHALKTLGTLPEAGSLPLFVVGSASGKSRRCMG